jgi:hypothetical protein
MPVRYSFEGNLFRMDLEGHYTPQEMMETLEAGLADPLLPADARFLLDVRESAELARRSAELIRTIAEFFAVRAERLGNCCAILTGSPVQYGLARVGASAIESLGVNVEVFSSLDEAVSWLGLCEESE